MIKSFSVLAIVLAVFVFLPPGAFAAPEGAPPGTAPNEYFERLAKSSRRGLYPRGFSGEQTYWTIVGVDGGGPHSALISEEGAVEPSRGGFSVEPFLIVQGRLLTWADVTTAQSLEDNYLPMPEVRWKTPGWELRVRAFGSGDPADSRLNLSYTVINDSNQAGEVTLVLAVRPFQVNPPTQTLNLMGGFSPIHTIDWNGAGVTVNGRERLFPLERPGAFAAAGFDSGDVMAKLAAGEKPCASHAGSKGGYASGAMEFRLAPPPHGRQSIHLLAPLSGRGTAGLAEKARGDPGGWMEQERRRVAAKWRAKLNDVSVRLPSSDQAIADTLRTSLAYILISRNGPALQPGTRSYARTWIRDGAMMSEALLRMGKFDVVRDFIDWYAPYQLQDGRIPCCVDQRGADPTPENDSNGEFIFTVAQLYRYTHDRPQAERLWPHVLRAVEFMDRLRARERAASDRTGGRRSFYDLMPASISHEGYWKKPMHSYWDDFWALAGYNDALYLARVLGKKGSAQTIAASRDGFRRDIRASIRLAARDHGINYVPGSAELGDLDPTSTTIALSPGDARRYLPPGLLKDTFELYWRDFLSRSEGKTKWNDYTPYELREVGAFTRLGWRHRVQPLLDFFLAGRRPAAWNGWAEVVRRNPRRPGFIGDMPHAWIASDFIRSVLDMLACGRRSDSSEVIAAGVPTAWLEGGGVGVSGLYTPRGRLSYTLERPGRDLLRLRINSRALPPGGFVLPWPYSGPPGRAVVNGRKVSWRNGELHIHSAQAEADVRWRGGEAAGGKE